MWLDRILASRTTRAVELAAAFSEERQRVLAENVANVDTPDYHTRRLDAKAFQGSLREALDKSRADRNQQVSLRGNAQFSTGQRGDIRVDPTVEPAPNKLFHDGTNARLEELMADVNQNEMWHSLALNLLSSRYGSLLKAIRGQVT